MRQPQDVLALSRHIVVGVCAVGIPASIQNLLNVTGMSVLNNFTSAFGANAVAAMGIAQKINSVHGADRPGPLPGHHAADQLQLRQRQHQAHEKDLLLHRPHRPGVPGFDGDCLLRRRPHLGGAVYAGPADCGLRRPVPAGLLPGHALLGHRLPGGGRVPGLRLGAKTPSCSPSCARWCWKSPPSLF